MREQKLDHVYVKDGVLANLKALESRSGISNVASGVGRAFNELVGLLNEALGTRYEPDYFDMPYNLKS